MTKRLTDFDAAVASSLGSIAQILAIHFQRIEEPLTDEMKACLKQFVLSLEVIDDHLKKEVEVPDVKN